MAAHEVLKRETEVKVGSDRSFGIVFTVVFAIVGLWPLTGEGGEPRLWALGAAAAFLVVSLVRPKTLRPLNLLWFKFGLLLHSVVNPLVMGLLFFVTVTPMGLLMRALGKDLLTMKRQPDAASYWILRDPPGPDAQSMRNQF